MDTQNLAAFVAVAHSGSFSQAGEALHLTQPAISKRISLLEQQLETRLFDRIGRQVSLTESGRTLLPRALEILDAIDRSRQAIADLSGDIRGELHLVTSHHIGLHRLPGILREYTVQFPRVRLNIQFMDSQQAYGQVLSGAFDLGIVTRGTVDDAQIRSETIWEDELVFVAAPDHPLSGMNAPALSDLSQFPALLPESRFYTTQIVESLFLVQGLRLQTLTGTNYLETIKALLTAGYAWGVLPRIMLRDQQLVCLPVKCARMARELDCIHHQNRSLSNPALKFLALLRKAAQQD